MNADFPIEEIWRDVVGYEGVYQVSNHGRVMRVSMARGAVLGALTKIHVNELVGGYCYVRLSASGKATSKVLHSLVARAFLGECPKGYEVNHIDADKLNNRVSNLEYVTRADNVKHAVKHGLNAHGETHGRAKLNARKAAAIRAAYVPYLTTLDELAQEHGVSISAIRAIVTGKTWKQDTPPARTQERSAR